MSASHKGRRGEGIPVVGPSKPVSAGRVSVRTESVEERETKKGVFRFLLCTITSPGKDHGREVEYMLPSEVKTDSDFWDFVVSAIGKPPAIGEEVHFDELIGVEAVVEIKHKRRGSGARSRVYANVVSISPSVKGARRR